MAKLSEVEEMLEKAEADEKKKKIITGHKNKKKMKQNPDGKLYWNMSGLLQLVHL